LDILHFRAPFGGLGSTYTIHLSFTGKLVEDFLVVLIELLSLDFTLTRYEQMSSRSSPVLFQ